MKPFTTLSRRLARAVPVLAVAIAPAFAVAGPPGVPFSGTFATQEVLRFDPSACPTLPYIAGTTTGSGHATHLGAATGIASDCITPTSPFTSTFSNGKLTLTAANGDQVRITYSGALTPSTTPLIATIAGTYRVEGGTGRFTGASGSGTVSGTENIATGQGQLGLNGTIAY